MSMLELATTRSYLAQTPRALKVGMSIDNDVREIIVNMNIKHNVTRSWVVLGLDKGKPCETKKKELQIARKEFNNNVKEMIVRMNINNDLTIWFVLGLHMEKPNETKKK